MSDYTVLWIPGFAFHLVNGQVLISNNCYVLKSQSPKYDHSEDTYKRKMWTGI